MTPIELNAALAYADFLDQHLPEIAGCPAGNAVRALIGEIGRLGNEIKQLRAIPSDRVLGEGMVQVDAARLAALESISAKIESLALGPDGRAWTPLHYREFARGELRAALRANQGGATT